MNARPYGWKARSSGFRKMIAYHRKVHAAHAQMPWRKRSSQMRKQMKIDHMAHKEAKALQKQQEIQGTVQWRNEQFRKNLMVMLMTVTLVMVLAGMMTHFVPANFLSGITFGSLIALASHFSLRPEYGLPGKLRYGRK
jgi:Na+/melibiose symporter-like transporter